MAPKDNISLPIHLFGLSMPPSITSLLSHPKGMLKEEFQRYKSVFKNYLSVTYHAARGIYPVKGVI